MRRIVLLICFISVSICAFAQNYRVVNQKGEGIPFATVHDYVNNNGVVTDKDGFFDYKSSVEVVLSSVGYLSDTVLLISSKEPVIFTLNDDIMSLSEIVVRAKALKYHDIVEVGFHNEKQVMKLTHLSNGSNYAVRIDNPRKEVALIKKLIFDIKLDKNIHALIRVVALDKNGIPSHDILRNNVIISDGNTFGNLTIDLEEYRIFLPENGAIIGFDVLPYLGDKKETKFKVGICANRTSRSYYLEGNGGLNASLKDLRVFGAGPGLTGNFMFGAKIAYQSK